MTRAITLVAFTAALAIAGCGGDGNGGSESDPPTADSGQTVDLRIVASDRARETRRAQITCGPDGNTASGFGDSNPDVICRAALGLAPFLEREPDPRRVCTQVYGGPEAARITGTIRERRIDRRLSRTDGCRISEWDRAQSLIPVEAG